MLIIARIETSDNIDAIIVESSRFTIDIQSTKKHKYIFKIFRKNNMSKELTIEFIDQDFK